MNAIHARSQLRYWPTLPRGNHQLYPIPQPGRAALSRRRCRARVRASQPVAQQMRRLVGGPPVKRHERGGNAGHAHDVRPPAICGDRRHLDQVRPTPDRFFKAMDNAGHSFLGKMPFGEGWILRVVSV
jgi:hypothetical protein